MISNTYFDSGDTRVISCIGDLMDSIEYFEKHYSGTGIYFRGQSDSSHSLKPSIGRDNLYKHGGKCGFPIPPDEEENLLHRFTRYSYEYTKRIITEWEALFLARHHGLPVRLLDWTSNPLVALFNAVLCDEPPRIDGAIWAFRRTNV
jgi:hypothetical protein